MSQLSALLNSLKQTSQPSLKASKRRKSKLPPMSYDKIVADAKKNLKDPWRSSSPSPQRKSHQSIMPGKVLTNWQMDRLLLSPRSYSRNEDDVKVSFKETFFNRISNRDKDGKMLYMYDSELPKLQRKHQAISQLKVSHRFSGKKDFFGARMMRGNSELLHRPIED